MGYDLIEMFAFAVGPGLLAIKGLIALVAIVALMNRVRSPNPLDYHLDEVIALLQGIMDILKRSVILTR